MPILGNGSGATGASGQTKRGVYVPTGCLDVWKAARNNHATARTEVVIFGDSTTYGSSSGSIPFYSWVQKIRELSIAAGYTDGGRGIAGIADTAALSGPENIAIIQSMAPANSWVPAGDGNDVLLTDTPNSATNGATIVFQGYGTACRLHYTRMGTCGTFTYSIDGGATTTIDANFSGFSADSILLNLGGTDTTLHTVTIVNTGSSQRASVVPEFMKTNGIVYHKHAISGISSNSFFGTANPGNGNYQVRAALGITQGLLGAGIFGWQQAVAARPRYRNPPLAIFALGINDMGGTPVVSEGSPTDAERDVASRSIQILENHINNFVKYTRAAGADPLIVVPHYDIGNHNHTWGGQFARASWAAGISHGCAVIDFNEVVRPMSTMVARNLGTPNIHADFKTYDAEATFLWNNALSL